MFFPVVQLWPIHRRLAVQSAAPPYRHAQQFQQTSPGGGSTSLCRRITGGKPHAIVRFRCGGQYPAPDNTGLCNACNNPWVVRVFLHDLLHDLCRALVDDLCAIDGDAAQPARPRAGDLADAVLPALGDQWGRHGGLVALGVQPRDRQIYH